MSPRAPKGRQKGAKGGQKEPKVSQRAPKGSQRAPKGSQRAPQGSQRAPKVTQSAPKGNQRTTKMHQKIDGLKRARKRRDHGDEIGRFWEPKTFKIACFYRYFVTLGVFEKMRKNERLRDRFGPNFDFFPIQKPPGERGERGVHR